MQHLKIPEDMVNNLRKNQSILDTYTYIEDELFYKKEEKLPDFFDKNIYDEFMNQHINNNSKPLKFVSNILNMEIQKSFAELFTLQEKSINLFREHINESNEQNINPREWVDGWLKHSKIMGMDDGAHLHAVLLNDVKDDFFEDALQIANLSLESAALKVSDYLIPLDVEMSDSFKQQIKTLATTDVLTANKYIQNVYSHQGMDDISQQIFDDKDLFKKVAQYKSIDKSVIHGVKYDLKIGEQEEVNNIFQVKRAAGGLVKLLAFYKETKNEQNFNVVYANLPPSKDLLKVLNNQFNNKPKARP